MKAPAAIIVILLFISCTKERVNPDNGNQPTETSSEARQASRNVQTNRNEAEGETRAVGLSQPAEKSTDETETRVRASRSVMQKDRLLSLRGVPPVLPEDFEIGILQEYDGTQETVEIVGLVQQFTRDLSSGVIPTQAIHPDWLVSLQRSLQHHADRGNLPTAVRIGAIRREGSGKASFDVRFYGEPGRTEGRVYLQKSENKWKIADLQVDLNLIGELPLSRNGLFEPFEQRYIGIP